MARPSLADSLKASLSKGVHVDTAERIKRGLQPVIEDPAPPCPSFLDAEKIPLDVISVNIPIAQKDNNTNNQTIKQSSGQADNQSNNQTFEQTIKQSDNQSINQSNRQSNNQSLQQLNSQPDKQSNEQSVNQSIEQTRGQTIEQAIEQSIKQTASPILSQTTRQRWLPFNENQGKLLLFLYEKGGGLTNMDIVVRETGIAYGTARAGIDVLIREGYITYKARHNGHSFRGFEYSMNNHLCSLYATKIYGTQSEQTIEQSNKQAGSQASKQTAWQSVGQSNKQTFTVVSSTKDLQSTTTENTEILKDPELGYWREKGVNVRQLNAWSDEFEMPLEQVIQSLKYCRYDMVVLNHEEEKQISNPINWFYKVMQRSGIYPKPGNYKTLAEIRAEQMEQAAREAAEARERQINAEHELAFQKILSDQRSLEYQQLLSKVNDFAKEVGGKALEAALREAFIPS